MGTRARSLREATRGHARPRVHRAGRLIHNLARAGHYTTAVPFSPAQFWVRPQCSKKRSFYHSTGQFLDTKKSLVRGSPRHPVQFEPPPRGTFTVVATGRATFVPQSGADLHENCLRYSPPQPPIA